MKPERRTLPQRRLCETFEMSFDNINKDHIVTIGRFTTGEIAEVFINFPKSGPAEAVARDGAVLLSIAIQYGVPLDVIRGAVTRGPQGDPLSIIGAVVDKLVQE